MQLEAQHRVAALGDGRPARSRRASWRAATRSTCCRRRSGSSPRRALGQVDELAQRRGVVERPLDHRLARPRPEQPRRRDEAGERPAVLREPVDADVDARQRLVARERPELAFAARVAAAAQAVEPALRRAVVAVGAAVQRELVAARRCARRARLRTPASAPRRGSAARRGSSPARRRRPRAPRRAFARRPVASTARRRGGRCRRSARRSALIAADASAAPSRAAGVARASPSRRR